MAPLRKHPRRLAAVVLAAGRGKRMKSALPKVLHDVCGRPCLWHVTRAALAAKPERLVFVVHHGAEEVEAAVRSWDLRPEPVFVPQGEPLGTGHAVLAAEGAVGDVDEVLVLSGDEAPVTGEHVRSVLRVHRRGAAAASILTTVLDDPSGMGRVVREGDRLVGIVQETDASPEVRAIREVSTLVYAFRREDLFGALPLVGRENRQHEHYLPDVLAILIDKGEKVTATTADFGGMLGPNSRAGFAKVNRIIWDRVIAEHQSRGVTVVDPATTYVDVDVRIGRDTVIHPMTFLNGDTRIGAGCSIGPGTRVVDSVVGDGSDVSFSVLRGARIGRRVSVGPYASLRPGTVIEQDGKAGTFVEMKNTTVGRGSKVPHLSYMGDATIGREVNVGAGSITCNYDGYAKHPTEIGDGAFIGSDTMLIAPISVGKGAWVGAGSALTRDVPAGALAVERSEQRIVPGYGKRRRPARGRSNGGRTSE